MGMRFLAACVILAVLFIGPFAHAQSNVVLVTTDQILLDFFETSTVFDNVFDAIAFANEPRNRIDTIQIDEDADPSTSEIDAWAAGALPEITVSLKIEGLGHPKDVILQGSTSDPVLTVSGTAELIVESLTLTGGSNGVHAMENSTLIVNRCIIRDNDEYGVKINEPAPDPEDPPEILVRDQAIYNSAITDNSGGGVLVEAAEGLLTVLGCTLIDNGDAIALPEGADADITNTLIYRNTGVDISGTSSHFGSAGMSSSFPRASAQNASKSSGSGSTGRIFSGSKPTPHSSMIGSGLPAIVARQRRNPGTGMVPSTTSGFVAPARGNAFS